MALSNDFRHRLRAARLAVGLTQEALAERAAISVRAIQNLERGERRPYPETTARLVAALGLQGKERTSFEELARPRPRARAVQPTQGAPLTNLPRPLNICVGRDSERADFAELIDGHRLVTLVGPGGCGKTRLALQLAADIVDDRATASLARDGIWLIELDAIGEPGLVPQSVATALGIRDEREQSLADTIVGALRGRSALLILDNCEHLLGACASLVEMIVSHCRDVRVLATSRQPLGLPGEVVRAVAPLDLPPSDSTPAPDTLQRYAAVALFLERARAAAPGIRITTDNAGAIAGICRRLDGVPLALELAAARLRSLSIQDLADRLDEPFGLLTSAGQRRPRQQSLRAAIDWSYNLLDAPLQALLPRLSVFAGGWTLEAAEAVCGAGCTEQLAQLVDHSLVQVDWFEPRGSRYRLLETVRQYAASRLEADPSQASAARRRHFDWCLRLAEQADAGMRGPEQLRWLRVLDAERGNIRAALHWALDQTDPRLSLRLAAAMGRYWDTRGEHSEGLTWLGAALARPELGAQATTERARALRASGRLALFGQKQHARACLDDGLALSRALHDRSGAVDCQVLLGQLLVDEADLVRAIEVLTQAVQLARILDDSRGLAPALLTMGQAELDRCHHTASLRHLSQSFELYQQLGDRVGQAQALRHLAMANLELRNIAAARTALVEQQHLVHELGDALGVAWAEHDLARLALETGTVPEALEGFQRSQRLFDALGHGTGIAWSTHNQGRAHVALGNLATAEPLFVAGLELFQRLDHARGTAWAHYNLAWLAAESGRIEQAWRWTRDALESFRSMQFAPGLFTSLVTAARLVVNREPALAARWLAAAEGLREQGGMVPVAVDRARADQVGSVARQRLGQSEFDVEYAAAAQLSEAELDAELDRVLARELSAV